MPTKKCVKNLEDLCLQLIPINLQNLIHNLLNKVKTQYEAGVPKRKINYNIELFIGEYKERLFYSIPAHFHYRLTR